MGAIIWGKSGRECPLVIIKQETEKMKKEAECALAIENKQRALEGKEPLIRKKKGQMSTDWYMHREQILPVYFDFLRRMKSEQGPRSKKKIRYMEDNASWHISKYLKGARHAESI